jgi:hypothetical protein
VAPRRQILLDESADLIDNPAATIRLGPRADRQLGCYARN